MVADKFTQVCSIISEIWFEIYANGSIFFLYIDYFVQLQKAVKFDITKNDLVNSYHHLLRDAEAEVRAAAAHKVKGNCINFYA